MKQNENTDKLLSDESHPENLKVSELVEQNENGKQTCSSQFLEKIKRFRGILIGLMSAFFLALSGILIRKASFVTASEQTVFFQN